MTNSIVNMLFSLTLMIYALWNLTHADLTHGGALAWAIMAQLAMGHFFWEKFRMWKMKRDEDMQARFERLNHG